VAAQADDRDGERFTCEELDTLADKLAHAEDARPRARASSTRGSSVSSRTHADASAPSPQRLAQWDVASALAEVAHATTFVRPEVDDSLELTIEDGRHPVVEKLAAAGRFVPNDVTLDASRAERTATTPAPLARDGAEHGGQVDLMRQSPSSSSSRRWARSSRRRRARIGVVDRVLTRVGASDNLVQGREHLHGRDEGDGERPARATRRSLVVLDEIGRGTSTYDGLAIAWAVAEHLHDVAHCRALFATHYHELTELAATRGRGARTGA
jgi:DNA mismatch repair protein MutS